ncbi:MAG: TIGR00341 family protein [Haloarculaceae archaeon]
MRLVQVTIPTGKRQAVLGVLDERGIDYVLTDETSGREYTGVAYFPLPTEAVEPVLSDLREHGLGDEAYTVVIDAETVVSRRFEQLEDEYQTDEGEGSRETRIAQQELRARAEELAPTFSTYVVLTVISTVVATAGLLLDSPATVVGSMVIAPLVGPAMASSVATVINDRDLFTEGAKLQLLGLPLAVLSSTVFALLARTLHLVPPGIDITAVGEISERVAPGLLTLVVALGAGIAGAVSLSAGVSTAIVGVMIAVALIPPAAVVGIGLAWGMPLVSLGAGILTLVNGLSINLMAIATLWYRNYLPRNVRLRDAARSVTVKRVFVLVAAICLLSLFLVGVTYDSFQKGRQRQAIDREAADVAADHAALTLLDTEVTYPEGSFFTPPARVVVTAGLPPGATPPSISDDLKSRIDRQTGGDVTVVVRYVTVEQSGPSRAIHRTAHGPSARAPPGPVPRPTPGPT